ncbi:hypothetical protein LCGC14_0263380 [marine sediment metagenome]|uniref:dTDP-4-dehydrorhamnose 3,5-epimerase n=1 Tax=marine sediment metagenome TaxID=412755 RepID=A0A0F9X655_9ZZZZ
MEIVKTQLDDVLLIKPDIFEDFRGDYVMTHNQRLYRETGIDVDFVEENVSISTKDVLRGIHYSPSCWKLNQCLYGRLYYVVVNCEEFHPEFGKWQSFILSDKNHYQLFKHPRYGSGFLVLSDHAVFHYKQSEYYAPLNPNQKTFKWDDPRFNIWWPTKDPILSQRDEVGHYL